MLSISTALSLYTSFSYVFVLYFASSNINDYKARRDDPRVIKSRMKHVLTIMAINIVLIPLLQSKLSGGTVSFKSAVVKLGLIPAAYCVETGGIDWDFTAFFSGLARSMMLVCILFCGPLLDKLLYYVLVPGVPLSRMLTDFISESTSIWGLRNYLFAPFTEELFYTSMLINNYLLLSNEITYKTLLLAPPAFFGIAHLHHGFEMYSLGIYGVVQILFSIFFQMLYTTMFGVFTNFIFIRTGGNLWSCVLTHCFCNYMGFPQGSELVQELAMASSEASGYYTMIKKLWKWCYLALLIIGAIEFKNNIWNLTESTHTILT